MVMQCRTLQLSLLTQCFAFDGYLNYNCNEMKIRILALMDICNKMLLNLQDSQFNREFNLHQ